jgi:hypothetical protein
MKITGKIRYITAIMFMLFMMSSICFAVDIVVDGRKLYLDTNPVSKNGAIFVPLRGIFEKMGASVVFNKQKNMVTAVRGDKTIRLTPGQSFAQINGFKTPIQQPAFIWKDRLYVPLRFLSEALGCRVGWHPPSRTVAISTNPKKDPLEDLEETVGENKDSSGKIAPIKSNINRIRSIEKINRKEEENKKDEKPDPDDDLSF